MVKNEKQIEELRKEEEEIVMRNMPTFERGIAEAALERESALWTELKSIFKKYNIETSVSLGIKSDNQPGETVDRPILVCSGIKATIEYIVTPIDRNGLSGNIKKKDLDRLVEIKKETARLMR